MKKLILGLIMVVLFVFSFVVPAFAYPPKYGLIKANKRKHIVRNYLYDSAGDVSGWVTFACQSVEGFQYSVAVRGLSLGTNYTVRAESLADVFVPGIGLVPTTDGSGNTYSLGTIMTNGEGEGEVDDGLIPLPATHPSLPFGLYGWEIKVADTTTGVDVLWTIPADPIDFVVFPAWP